MKKGAAFEKLVAERLKIYESARLLVLRKVDPPTRVIGKGRIIYLPNPFLDYVGSWAEVGGRAVFIEAKETKNNKLGVGQSSSSGITVKQLHSLRVWQASGAVAAVLWKTPHAIHLIPLHTIEAVLFKTKLKHVKEHELPPFCRCGRDSTLNLLEAMRRIYGVASDKKRAKGIKIGA